MAEFADLRRLHRRVDEHQEGEGEGEGEETLDFSLPFTFTCYDHAIHPSGTDEHGSIDGPDQLLGELDESLTPDPSSGRGYPVEDTERRYLDQVDLVLDLFDHFSNAQLDSRENSSIDSRSAVDFGGHDGEEDELGSNYLGLGFGFRLGLMLGFDAGDWRRLSEQEYQENDASDVVCDAEHCRDHSIDDESIVDEELGDLHPLGFTTSTQSFSTGGSVIESGDQSVVLGVESRPIGAIPSIFGVDASDVVDVDGDSCDNGDFLERVDGFGVVGLETDSDEEEDVDIHDGACRVPVLFANSDVDNRSESDALSTDLGIPLCWDCLHLDDRRDSNEDFEWEEVNGGIDESEVLSQADSIYVERMVVDTVEDRMVPSEMWQFHEPNSVEVTNVEVHSEMGAGYVEDAAEAMENLDWAVLLTVNNLETNNPDHEEQNPEFYAGDHDDFVYTAEYEILLGQFTDTDSLPKGVPPASKAFVDSLPSVLLTQEDLDSSRNLCAVCKDDISRDELVKRLPCSHFYHGDCILPWLNLRNTCPVCRYQLPTDDPEYEQWRSQNRLFHLSSIASIARYTLSKTGTGLLCRTSLQR